MSQFDGMYYLQDSRSYVGNDVQWWIKDGNGYTTDLDLAHLFTKEEALQKQRLRSSDIPWSAAYIRSRSRPAVDFQHISREDESSFVPAPSSRDAVLEEAAKKCKDMADAIDNRDSERAKCYDECATAILALKTAGGG